MNTSHGTPQINKQQNQDTDTQETKEHADKQTNKQQTPCKDNQITNKQGNSWALFLSK